MPHFSYRISPVTDYIVLCTESAMKISKLHICVIMRLYKTGEKIECDMGGEKTEGKDTGKNMGNIVKPLVYLILMKRIS